MRTFSATGGIEKVCRILGKALYEESLQQKMCIEVASMYDHSSDAWGNQYFPAEIFRGYRIHKWRFIKDTVIRGIRADRIILSHINLLPVGWLIKKISPRTKIVLLAHGIEIWYPLRKRVRNMLRQMDMILAVSRYTRDTVIKVHGVSAGNCRVLNNCLDPRTAPLAKKDRSAALLKKYGFEADDKILMTLTRLSSKERYKGYDYVLKAVALLKEKYPGIKYLLAGSYDEKEKAFMDKIIAELGIGDKVCMTGYIEDDEVADNFGLSTLYIMPSRKEGFGLVFIEAMYYGLPVIAGNQDGSADALLNGQLGQLVDPDDEKAVAAAIERVLADETSYIPDRNLLMEHFSYEAYKRKVRYQLPDE